MSGHSWLLKLPLGKCKSTFNLEKAVCNHGFFMMAPNRWIPSSKILQRPLRLADNTTSVTVLISHPPDSSFLCVQVYHSQTPSPADQRAILKQVTRMLRLTMRDETIVTKFQSICPEAKDINFGRIFVRPLSLKMLSSASSFAIAGKRKRAKSEKLTTHEANNAAPMGNFPNFEELVNIDESCFLEKFKPILGYRAEYILELVEAVKTGRVSFQDLENSTEEQLCYEQVYQNLAKIKGFGHFTCANVLMCMGHYEIVPADTETLRHIRQVHGMKNCNKKTMEEEVRKLYDKYAPFQCLAYWMELLDRYEYKVGKLSELSSSRYHLISSVLFQEDTSNK
ncbi:hypothetical protein FNV43_RR21214 [Rhamnella rubrinervis]|uniref:DNA-(apurinic or apyrimidinic site) lyase n=1 Tax=Rhamnella rubrinervis TaxID=2594499 RepID=A0A8K0DVU6_9ROSA|nr:hypothetical protein FNV43_RR21214 [Rhamnella rubrinervis]